VLAVSEPVKPPGELPPGVMGMPGDRMQGAPGGHPPEPPPSVISAGTVSETR
jgi:hypothetical protein